MKQIRLFRTTVFRFSMRYAAGFSLLATCCLALIYWGMFNEIRTQIDAGLRGEVDALLRLDKVKGADALRHTIDALSTPASLAQSDTGDTGPRQYLLTSSSGTVLAGTLKAWPLKADSSPSAWVTLYMTAHGHEPGLDSAHRYRLRANIQLLPGGDHLLIGQSLNETDELDRQMLILMLIIVVLILAAGLGGGWWVGRSVVRRLEQVTAAADRIMAGDLAQRIPETERRNDEFTFLAHVLNVMLERIEQLMRSTREVTENVAHDLRSPLTRLRGAAEMALLNGDSERQRDALRKAIEQTDAVVATLNAILSIAQIESGPRGESATVDLTAVCRDAAELYEALAEEKDIHFLSEISDSIKIKGNSQLIAQAVGNLLDNAIKYTPDRGSVTLALKADTSDVRIIVSDSGPGIPRNKRDSVLRRFVRLDVSRSLPGNGIGLSLVKAMADQHGAILQLGDNLPGLKISLIFNRETI